MLALFDSEAGDWRGERVAGVATSSANGRGSSPAPHLQPRVESMCLHDTETA
jgi:hypothetical protein